MFGLRIPSGLQKQEAGPTRFVQAKNFTAVPDHAPRRVKYVVLHSMESQERLETAENVAAWFAGPDAPRASAHYLVDGDSIIQQVRDEDVAWHAPGANRQGIGVELAGRASQTAEQWLDGYSGRVLELAAALVAELCLRHHVPVRALGAAGLLMGDQSGITTHAAVSAAFRKSTHTDPGEGFPLNAFVEMVRRRRIA